MNKITFPLNQRMRGTAVADLQDVLQQCLERGVLLANDEPARHELSARPLALLHSLLLGKLRAAFLGPLDVLSARPYENP